MVKSLFCSKCHSYKPLEDFTKENLSDANDSRRKCVLCGLSGTNNKYMTKINPVNKIEF